MSSGSMHQLNLAAEDSTYAAVPTTPTWTPIRHSTANGGISIDTFISEELRSDCQVNDVAYGPRKVAFSFGYELSFTSFDTILEAILGGTWTDDVLKSGTTRRSFPMERYFSDQVEADKPYHLYKGTEFGTLSLQIGTGNIAAKGTIGGLAQDVALSGTAIGSSTYSDAETTGLFNGFSGLVLEEGGGALAVATDIQINIDRGLEPFFVLGSTVTERPTWKKFKLTGTVTARYANSAMLEKFLNGTESSLQLTLTDSVTNELDILIPRIKYTGGGEINVGGEGPITIALPFEGLYDPTEESNIVITRTEYTPPGP